MEQFAVLMGRYVMITFFHQYVVMGVCMLFVGQCLGGQPRGVVLRRLALTDGSELVMTKGAFVPVAALGNLLPPKWAEPTTRERVPLGYTSRSVEVRVADGGVFALWSGRYPLYLETDYDELQVLDAMLVSDRLVVAWSMPRSRIEIHVYSLSREDHIYRFEDSYWRMLGAALPARPGQLGAKLTYDPRNRRVQVHVTETLQGVRQHTFFEQKDDSNELVTVKRWQEDVDR